jgi:hypothetical protein
MLGLAAALLAVSCGGTDSTTTTVSDAAEATVSETEADSTSTTADQVTTTKAGASADDPCALVTPEQVAAVFAAASATGEAGVAFN